MYPKSKLLIGSAVVVIFLTAYVPECHGGALGNRLDDISNPLIIQGKNTDIEKVPYQVAIEKLRIHSCGGSILSDSWIVTAAYCVHPNTSSSYGKTIRAGSTTAVPLIEWGGSVHDILKTEIHPYFHRNFLDYDIAVIKVSKNFVFGQNVQPIKVPRDEEFIDYKLNATVSGWGKTSANDWFQPFRLQSAEVPLVTRAKCLDILNSKKLPNFLSIRMICAGGKGSDSYVGDTGGPLVQKGQLIGIVSWGRRDATHLTGIPGIYTNAVRVDIRAFIRNRANV